MITDKILTLHINIPSEREKICAVGRALSVPDRVRILNLLTARSMNLNEISKVLDIPVSSVSNHINALQDAELVLVSYQPSAKGHVKLCSEMVCMVQIKRATPKTSDNDAYCMEMPVGMYTDCDIKAPCGMASAEKQLLRPTRRSTSFCPSAKMPSWCGFRTGMSVTCSRIPRPKPNLSTKSASRWSCVRRRCTIATCGPATLPF